MADDLVGRVERLERSARRWRWSAIGLGTALVALVAAGAAPRAALTASSLTLLDAEGNKRIILDPVSGFGPLIEFRDEQGEARLMLYQSKNGPKVRLIDQDNKAMAELP